MSSNVRTEDWKYQHNYLHHSFTNTDYDHDYGDNQLLLRHSNKHVYYFHHKFQFIYALVLFIFGAFSKGPYYSIKNRRWNIVLFLLILYNLGYIHTIIMYGLTGMLFLMLKSFSIGKAAGVSFFVGGIFAVLLWAMNLINNKVLTISVIFAVLGLILLIKESSKYEN